MAKKNRRVGGGGKTTKKGRGGRRPGTWTLITPESLRAWREKNGVSRASVATMLGVSSTSVQNWETGHAIATTKTQQRLAELTSGAPAGAQAAGGRRGAAAAGAAAAPRASGGDANGALIEGTAAIVVEAIRSSGKKGMSANDLAALIRTVRDALA